MPDLMTSAAQCSRLDALTGVRAAQARLFAAEVEHLAELHDLAALEAVVVGQEQFQRLELAGTMRLAQLTTERLQHEALHLRDVLHRTLSGLHEGSIWVAQAQVIVQETLCCSTAVAWEVERRVLDAGGGQQFPGDLRRRLRRTLLAVRTLMEPEALAEREDQARTDRRVSRWMLPDGMEALYAALPAEAARRHHAALEELVRLEAEADRERGIERTTDQRRADVLASLPAIALAALRAEKAAADAGRVEGDGASSGALLPGGPRGVGGVGGAAALAAGAPDASGAGLVPVRPAGPACAHRSATELIVLMPFATLMGWSGEPAVLQGYGPISSAQALALVPDARLRLAAIDATTGQPVHVANRTTPAGADLDAAREVARGWLDSYDERDPLVVVDAPEPRYAPSDKLARLVRVRDLLCTAPGCSCSAWRCDLDHGDPWAQGGPTVGWNLGPKSRFCHRAKTQTWTCTRNSDGSHTWTSPLGRGYDRPPAWDPPPDCDLPPPGPPPPKRTWVRPAVLPRNDLYLDLLDDHAEQAPQRPRTQGTDDCPF